MNCARNWKRKTARKRNIYISPNSPLDNTTRNFWPLYYPYRLSSKASPSCSSPQIREFHSKWCLQPSLMTPKDSDDLWWPLMTQSDLCLAIFSSVLPASYWRVKKIFPAKLQKPVKIEPKDGFGSNLDTKSHSHMVIAMQNLDSLAPLWKQRLFLCPISNFSLIHLFWLVASWQGCAAWAFQRENLFL